MVDAIELGQQVKEALPPEALAMLERHLMGHCSLPLLGDDNGTSHAYFGFGTAEVLGVPIQLALRQSRKNYTMHGPFENYAAFVNSNMRDLENFSAPLALQELHALGNGGLVTSSFCLGIRYQQPFMMQGDRKINVPVDCYAAIVENLLYPELGQIDIADGRGTVPGLRPRLLFDIPENPSHDTGLFSEERALMFGYN